MDRSPAAAGAGSNGNRSKVDGHVKQRVHQTLTDELTRRPPSGGGGRSSWPGSLNPVDESRWGQEEEEEEEEEDEVKEMKGNSLVNNAGQKNNFDHRYKSVSQQNHPDESSSSSSSSSFVSTGSAGPPFSDQDQVTSFDPYFF